jgi:hypothetical protein
VEIGAPPQQTRWKLAHPPNKLGGNWRTLPLKVGGDWRGGLQLGGDWREKRWRLARLSNFDRLQPLIYKGLSESRNLSPYSLLILKIFLTRNPCGVDRAASGPVVLSHRNRADSVGMKNGLGLRQGVTLFRAANACSRLDWLIRGVKLPFGWSPL